MDPSFNPNPHLKQSNPKHNTKVIKPRPHILSKKSFPVCSDEFMKFNTPAAVAATPAKNNSVSVDIDIDNGSSYCFSKENDEIMWWENLMMNENEVDYQGWIDDIDLSVLGEQAVDEKLEVVEEDNYDSLGELYLDDQLLHLFNQ
ncbi:hypothetical protein V6N13_137677 [Hibiscus sabdariffa]